MKPTVENFDFNSVEVPEEVKKTCSDMLYKKLLEQWKEEAVETTPVMKQGRKELSHKPSKR